VLGGPTSARGSDLPSTGLTLWLTAAGGLLILVVGLVALGLCRSAKDGDKQLEEIDW
jgi:hypothetical protein